FSVALLMYILATALFVCLATFSRFFSRHLAFALFCASVIAMLVCPLTAGYEAAAVNLLSIFCNPVLFHVVLDSGFYDPVLHDWPFAGITRPARGDINVML